MNEFEKVPQLNNIDEKHPDEYIEEIKDMNKLNLVDDDKFGYKKNEDKEKIQIDKEEPAEGRKDLVPDLIEEK